LTLPLARGTIADMQWVPNQLSLRLAMKPFRDFVRFSGRSTRSELLSFWCLYVAALFVLVTIGFAGLEIEKYLLTTVAVVFLLPTPALVDRRLHDVGLPGWPAAFFVVVYGILANATDWGIVDPAYRFPLAVRIIINLVGLALLVACLWNETPGANRYGPDPRLDPQDAALAPRVDGGMGAAGLFEVL
jgi:uncharacterized membrane protein YhaH (DUF805 family)